MVELQELLEDVAQEIADVAEDSTENVIEQNIDFDVVWRGERLFVDVLFENVPQVTPGMAAAQRTHYNDYNFVYQEWGGARYRPPPMPLRRAAEVVTGVKVKKARKTK